MIGLVEAIKHPGEVRSRNPGTVVLHRDDLPPGECWRSGARKCDDHGCTGKCKRVLHEIGQNLRQAIGVDHGERLHIRREVDRQLHTAALGRRAKSLRRGAHHFGHIRWPGGDRHLIGFEFGQIEQVSDQSLQSPGFRNDHSGRLGGVLDCPVGDGLRKAPDRRQWRPEIVRDGQQEMTLPVSRLFEALCHLVDGAGQRGRLGVVAVPQWHPALEVPRRDARRGVPRFHQRAGHATAQLPGHQRRDEKRPSSCDEEVAPARAHVAHIAGQDDDVLSPGPGRRTLSGGEGEGDRCSSEGQRTVLARDTVSVEETLWHQVLRGQSGRYCRREDPSCDGDVDYLGILQLQNPARLPERYRTLGMAREGLRLGQELLDRLRPSGIVGQDDAAGAGDHQHTQDEADEGQHQSASQRVTSSSEPVSDTPDGGEREAVAELLAELGHMDVDRALVAVPIRTPHAVEKLLA